MAIPRTTQDVLTIGRRELSELVGTSFDTITVEEPQDIDMAIALTKIISKLSPLVGNLIEHEVCRYLNSLNDFKEIGVWRRQDPDFPDAIFDSPIKPTPGFEIKAWFPLATEITARFKESQKYFLQENTDLVLLAWLPDHLFYGKPTLLDVVCVPASQVAKSRDDHYHNPPDYLVLEPEDTESRTRNLQQSCVNGHKIQEAGPHLHAARQEVEAQGEGFRQYSFTIEYQSQMQELINRYRYRLDTNFAKIDRIGNPSIEAFKTRVLESVFYGRQVQEWSRTLARSSESDLARVLSTTFDIG